MDQAKLKAFLEKLADHFASPFLPKGFVVLTLREDGSHILSIGDRDVELGREGEFTGSGTNAGPAKEWRVTKA